MVRKDIQPHALDHRKGERRDVEKWMRKCLRKIPRTTRTTQSLYSVALDVYKRKGEGSQEVGSRDATYIFPPFHSIVRPRRRKARRRNKSG